MEEKKWYTYTHSIVMIAIIGVLLLLLLLTNIEVNTEKTSTATQNNYEYVSHILTNNSKENIEKLVTAKEISSEDMKRIYDERKDQNQDFEKYTIWFFSNKEDALKADTYELGYISNENGEVVIKNLREEEQQKAIEQQEKQEEEQAIKEIKEQEEEAKKSAEQKEKEFKKACKTYSFEELARNPEKMKNKKVKLTGEVIQVQEGIYTNSLRVNITKDEYDFYEDTIYVTYAPEEGEDKILEDDIITIWGISEGDYTYTSVLGANITLPYISAQYLEIK